jgi:hypothetical protein
MDIDESLIQERGRRPEEVRFEVFGMRFGIACLAIRLNREQET